jgi:hypothetical protein
MNVMGREAWLSESPSFTLAEPALTVAVGGRAGLRKARRASCKLPPS